MRVRLALVIAGQERSSQLDHRPESFEEVGAEFEQAARVEAPVSKAGENLFRESQSIRPAQTLLAPVPEQQVLVVLVVFIKVEVFARSLPHGAVRLFTQRANVRHHTADFVMGGHGERQVSSLGNDLSLQAPLDLLLPVRRQRGDFDGRQRRWRFLAGSAPAEREQVAAGPHDGIQFTGIGEGIGILLANGMSNGHLKPRMVFVHDFLRQHDGSKSGVHQAGQLERHPVVSGKADGHDWGAASLGHAMVSDHGGSATKGRVNRAWSFTCGKDRQQASISQVAEGGTHAHGVCFGPTTQHIHESKCSRTAGSIPEFG